MVDKESYLGKRMSRRDVLRVLGLASLAGVAAACSPAPTAAPKSSGTSAPAAGAAPTAAPSVKASTSAPQIALATSERFAETLEPSNQTTLSIFQTERHVLEPLLERNTSGKFVPMLAESWSMVDNLTWQFNLRKGVKFHNGEEFNAESVKYTIDKVARADSKMKQHSYWGDRVKSVEIKDPYTAIIHTNVPFGTLLAVLTLTVMEPPKLAASDPQWWNKTLIGTGPFRWADYQKDQQLTLEANPDYWQGAPKLSKILWRFIPETSTRLAAFKAGEVQIVDAVPPEEIANINKMSDAGVASATTYQQINVGFNCGKAPFNNKLVRQALNYAVDKDSIVKDFLQGYGSVAVAPAPITVFGAVKQPPYSYDPAKAKEMLSQAGVSGVSFLLDEQGQYPKGFEICQFIASQLQQVGVNCKVNKVEVATWQERRNKGVFDASYIGFANVTGDADMVFSTLFYSMLNPTTPNRTRYNNPKADEAIKKGATSVTDQDRMAAYTDACKILWDDAPHIWLYDTKAVWGVRKNVKGFEARPDTFTIVRNVSIG